jgi:phospho-N-acetylmuramoyl-pentapeptide-transferase
MGGIIILAGILGGALSITWIVRSPSFGLGADLFTPRCTALMNDLLAVLLLVIGYAILGMVDDYLTIHAVRGVRGISSRPKAAVQILLAIAFMMWLAQRPGGFAPVLHLSGIPLITGTVYWVFSVIFIVGMANFVNITDGLDGLVAGLAAIACTAFVLVIALVPPHSGFDQSTLVSLAMAAAGACLAFLWFNTNPARVFMGDTGALALGVALPAIAILTHREVLMIAVSLVFVLDGLSSALQWAVFKFTRITTGAGRRVFKKSPIHHHFELSGWPEQTIVIRFWILGALSALIAFAGAAWKLW